MPTSFFHVRFKASLRGCFFYDYTPQVSPQVTPQVTPQVLKFRHTFNLSL